MSKTATERRIQRDDYYLNIAEAVAEKSTCTRYSCGAVLVNHDEIVATGYNGSPRGCINCTDVGCFCGMLHTIGRPIRDLCVAVHAIENVMISASRNNTIGGTIYVVALNREITDKPHHLYADPEICIHCHKLLVNAGLTRCVGRKPVAGDFAMSKNTELDISPEYLMRRIHAEYDKTLDRLEADSDRYIKDFEELAHDANLPNLVEEDGGSEAWKNLLAERGKIVNARNMLNTRKQLAKNRMHPSSLRCPYTKFDFNGEAICGLTDSACSEHHCVLRGTTIDVAALIGKEKDDIDCEEKPESN